VLLLPLLLILLLLLLQVCWGMDGGTCAQADILAALDKAVADGVDVINMSLGSNTYEFPDMLATALLQVARAGVFVAAAGGNDGPEGGSVENASPWITSVAASSHNRAYRATTVLSSSSGGTADAGKTLTLTGAGFYNEGLAASPVIMAHQGAKASANMARAQQCYSGTLDVDKVKGKVVVSAAGNRLAVGTTRLSGRGGDLLLLLRMDICGVSAFRCDDVNCLLYYSCSHASTLDNYAHSLDLFITNSSLLYTLTHSLSLTRSLTRCHSLTHALSLTHSLSVTHSVTVTQSLSLTHSLTVTPAGV
jgi:hypothetical protein